jgi:hypothetical protein
MHLVRLGLGLGFRGLAFSGGYKQGLHVFVVQGLLVCFSDTALGAKVTRKTADGNRATWFLIVLAKGEEPLFGGFKRIGDKSVEVFEATGRVEVFVFVESATFEGIYDE